MKKTLIVLAFLTSVSVQAQDHVVGDLMSPDTFEIRYQSTVEMVHLLGVRGPDLYHPSCKKEERKYAEAMAYLADKLVHAQTIYFSNVVLQNNLVYANIFIDSQDLGADLVSQGLARAVTSENPWCK